MGRRKGSVNKISAEARGLIDEAFKRLGGVDGLVRWAQKSDKHLTVFYKSMYMKLVPSQMNFDVSVEGRVVRNYTGLPHDDASGSVIEAEAKIVPPVSEEPGQLTPPRAYTPVGRDASGEFRRIVKPVNGNSH